MSVEDQAAASSSDSDEARERDRIQMSTEEIQLEIIIREAERVLKTQRAQRKREWEAQKERVTMKRARLATLWRKLHKVGVLTLNIEPHMWNQPREIAEASKRRRDNAVRGDADSAKGNK